VSGTLTAGLCVGGVQDLDASSPTSNVEEYDGTSWTAGNNAASSLITELAGAGVQTAAIFTGISNLILNLQFTYTMELIGQLLQMTSTRRSG
jgi:hypothetical protein